MVKAIMENERRWGDLDVRKRIVIDYVAGKTTKNIKQRVKAFVPEHHAQETGREYQVWALHLQYGVYSSV